MRILSIKDKALLEKLTDKMGVDNIAEIAMKDMTEENDTDELDNIDMISNKNNKISNHHFINTKEAILDFLCKLEGYQTFLKEEHWQAEHRSIHELADSVCSNIHGLQDDIAEDIMGYLGIRIKHGDLVPTAPEAEDLKTMLEELREDALTLRSSIENESVCYGIISMLDDMVHNVNKYLYLETFL